jgi:hypothetical protein
MTFQVLSLCVLPGLPAYLASGQPETFVWPEGRRGAFSLSFDDGRESLQ